MPTPGDGASAGQGAIGHRLTVAVCRGVGDRIRLALAAVASGTSASQDANHACCTANSTSGSPGVVRTGSIHGHDSEFVCTSGLGGRGLGMRRLSGWARWRDCPWLMQ